MLIATTNPGKRAEFAGFLSPLGIELTSVSHDFPETRNDFVENAKEKAENYAKKFPGHWILVEDSGLVVPALGGFPGPWSARFHVKLGHYVDDPTRIDQVNNALVLQMMSGIPFAQRGAYFISCLVVTDPQGSIAFETTRESSGWILTEPRGENGFGYDPIFASDRSFGDSWAEIDPARKSLISHRSKVMWDFMAWVCSTNCEVR